MAQQREEKERLSVTVPASLKRQVEQRAQANRRSVARQVQVELEGAAGTPGSPTHEGAST